MNRTNEEVVVNHVLGDSHRADISKHDNIWYQQKWTLDIIQQAVLSEHILSRAPKQLSNLQTTTFVRKVKTQKNRSSKFESKIDIDLPIKIIVGFHGRNNIDDAAEYEVFSYRQHITGA